MAKNTESLGSLVLILGGVRSGKSRFAEHLAHSLGGDNVAYVATAEVHDDEMRRRIEKHRERRPAGWVTYEVPQRIGEFFTIQESPHPVLLIDCLTLFVSNMLCDWDYHRANPTAHLAMSLDALEARILQEVDAIADLALKRGKHVVLVSGEVGLGIVPESELGRIFRDLLGFANQRLSAKASETIWMIAGRAIPLAPVSVTPNALAKQLMKLPVSSVGES